jgi:drug/metabolite transporter (DMT)-like permease
MAMGSGFTFDLRVSYIGSLLYLSLIGSVLGFACYFALLRRIQAERAAYATVLFPIVALFLSTLFEDYRWTLMAFGGIGLTLIGNVLVLGKPRATASPRRK